MQDGEYTLDGSPLPIPGAVFVFAGATASSFSEFLPQAPEDVHRFQAIKGPDFVSRLKGILDIKGPNPTCVTDKKHIIRRAMLLRSLILKNVKGICHPDTGRVDISRGLLCALLRVSEYRHGARSIEFILGNEPAGWRKPVHPLLPSPALPSWTSMWMSRTLCASCPLSR